MKAKAKKKAQATPKVQREARRWRVSLEGGVCLIGNDSYGLLENASGEEASP